MHFSKLILVATLALVLIPGQAEANRMHPQAGAMCRAECMQTAGSRLGANPHRAAQACAIRCRASVDFLSQQNRAGSAAATGRGQAPGTVRGAAIVAPRRLGRAERRQIAARTAALRAAADQRAGQLAPPVQPVASFQAPRHGVIYGARTPSAGFGMAVGDPDRMAAHRRAQRACVASGPDCRVLAEFSDACGSAAHGVVPSQWALFMTSDPNSYVVTSLSAGYGHNRAMAERDALSECRARDRQATCRITATACVPRR